MVSALALALLFSLICGISQIVTGTQLRRNKRTLHAGPGGRGLTGRRPALAAEPSGKTLCISNRGGGTVTPINIATSQAGKAFQAPCRPG